MAAEIQQTSDITYRVYDWDRTDDTGQKRELHTHFAEQATKQFDISSKSDYTIKPNKAANLVNCEYFTTNIIDVQTNQTNDYSGLDSFVIFMCVEGTIEITTDNHTETLKMGETILLPAITKEVLINSDNGKLLEVYID